MSKTGPIRVSAVTATATRGLATLAIGGALLWIAADNGTYSVGGRTELALAVVWGLALSRAFGLWRFRLGVESVTALAALALFAATTGLSGLWASSAESAFAEFDRTLLYLVIVVVGIVGMSALGIERWIAALAGAAAGVALLAFASRLFPTALHPPNGAIYEGRPLRLSYPLGYWNGLGIWVALGLPLLLRQGIDARHRAVRLAALAPVPVVIAVIYLTASRGAVIVAVLSTLTLVLLTPRSAAAASTSAATFAAGAALVALIRRYPELVDGPLTAVTPREKTNAVAAALILCATGAVVAELVRSRLINVRRGVNAAAGAVVLVTVVGGVFAVHPVRRFDEFRRPPTAAPTNVQSHLLAANGGGRWQLWSSAIDEFRSRPLVGRGAGSFGEWWAQHGTLNIFVRDAHSVFLQVAGELGLAGLVPIVAFFAVALAAGGRRWWSSAARERSAYAALLAALAGYLLAASIDWMWQLPAVSVVAMLIVGLVLPRGGGVQMPPSPSRRRPAAVATAAALAAGAAGIVVAQGIVWLATTDVVASQAAASAGEFGTAATWAARASDVEPFAASPKLQLALVRERAADLAGARDAIRAAVAADPRNWQLWLVRARVAAKLGRGDEAARSLERARQLNPRSPLFGG